MEPDPLATETPTERSFSPEATPTPQVDRPSPLYEVSPQKFVIISAVSVGLYPYYWMYRTWQKISLATGQQMRPLWRAIFGVYWAFSLLPTLRRIALLNGIKVTWNPYLLAIAFFVMSFAWRISDPWLVVSYLAFVVLIPVVRTAQQINRLSDPTERPDIYSVRELIALMIGAILTFFVLLGILFDVSS